MRNLILPFLFLSLLENVTGQGRQLDSLNTLIAEAGSDTTRINLLNEKANIYTQQNLDSSISITNSVIKKAQELHYLKAEARAYSILGTALTYKGSFGPAATSFNSAEKLYKQTADSVGLYNVYAGYGMYYGMQSKYDSSIFFFRKDVSYQEKNANPKKLASAYQNLAVSYTMSGDYENSLLYQGKGLKLAESINDTNTIAYLSMNMGINFSNVGDYTQSEELFLRAMKFARAYSLTNVELYAQANLASTSISLAKNEEGYEYALSAVKLGKQLGDYAIVATSLSRVAIALVNLKRLEEAEKFAQQAIHLADSVGAPLNIYQAYQTMGFVKNEKKQFASAVKYYEKGFNSLKDADIYDSQIGYSYRGLSEAYEQVGEFAKALETYKTSKKILDSLQSRQNIRRTMESQMNYEFDKKEQAVKAEQDRKNAINYSKQLALIIGLGFMAVLIVVAIIAYRNKRKANFLLQIQKEELQNTLGELKLTQAQLIQSEKMASLGELTAGIAHEIQNPLNFVNNFSEVNKEMISELKEELSTGNYQEVAQIADTIGANEEKINHHGKRADSIVKGMLQHSRKNTGEKIAADINLLADEYLHLAYMGIRAKETLFTARLETDFDETIGVINIVPQDIGRVLLNLYNNALYAVSEKNKQPHNTTYEPVIRVSTNKAGNNVVIKIADNGAGIPPDISGKVFQPFFTTKPTGEGIGLGLSLAYDAVKAHGGEITMISKEGEGTDFTITLPA